MTKKLHFLNGENIQNKNGIDSIPMSTAVDMFLNQVVLVGGIPFSVTVPKPPADIDVTQMTEAQLHAKLQRGYDDYKAGRTHSAAEAFAKFREIHS